MRDSRQTISITRKPAMAAELVFSYLTLTTTIPVALRPWYTRIRPFLRDSDVLSGAAELRRIVGNSTSTYPSIKLVAALTDGLFTGQSCYRSMGFHDSPELKPGYRVDQPSRFDQEWIASDGPLNGYYRALLEPYASQITAAIEFERRQLTRFLLTDGPMALLDYLDKPAQSLGTSLGDHQAQSTPQDITVILSVFCEEQLVVLDHDSGRSLVLQPMSPTARLIALADPSGRRSSPLQSLEKLLGRTRASILCNLYEACSTTQVAKRWRISAPTASRHLSILREAGLVQSRRQANEVHHMLTSLGQALVRQPPLGL
ncbi:winged helix-turn-helix domain-containing protein [Micromonospora sp. LOL_015]|uniref:winged helix-turn-helix domain-containing protein n=1 Tax=Micromonospora sp. LOL_015 TaxID=3345416 RepID=UPI003A85EC3F